MGRNLSLTSVNDFLSPNRFLGGSDKSVHPFVKGYFYAIFEFNTDFNLTKSLDSANNTTRIKNIILSLAEDFTPPGDRQLITEDLPGIGGVDASFVVKQQIDRTFSLQFRDVWGSPIFRIHRALTSILDPYWGGALNGADYDLSFIPKEYKFKVWVIQTRPIAIYASDAMVDNIDKYIEKVFIFDGTIPITDIMSAYNSNIQDNSLLKATIQYRFDGMPIDETYDDGVITKAADKLKTLIANKGKSVSY